MITREKANGFVQLARKLPVLDVRSPGEYDNGHIPGAILFPLFTNEERAEVGTLYKQMGQMHAMARGMELVGPKVGPMFAQGMGHAREGKIMVHCWRGGKRSEAVADLLHMAGLEVWVLEGGYKAFRNWVLRQFERTWPIAIVGGMTGTGKTEVLHALQRLGHPTVDLEALADHKGSSFGRLGATKTITFTQFENDLAWELEALGPEKTIWLEDESRTIGSLHIPNGLWIQMMAAPLYVIELPKEVRMERLLQDYGNFPKEDLGRAIQRLRKRLGGLRTDDALTALSADDGAAVLDILLDYYDKAYAFTLTKRKPAQLIRLPFARFDAEAIAAELAAFGTKLDPTFTNLRP